MQHPNTVAGIVQEAADALCGMPSETFEALRVREFLPDELHGLALMLREGSFVLSPRHPDQVGRLPAHTERHFDAIDAGFFSGDTFHNEDALDRFAWYVARWQRQIVSIREMMAHLREADVERESDEDAPDLKPGSL